MNGLQNEINSLKTSVSEGKSLIAAAVTGKGVPTAADATFQQMANNIWSIVTMPVLIFSGVVSFSSDTNPSNISLSSPPVRYVRVIDYYPSEKKSTTTVFPFDITPGSGYVKVSEAWEWFNGNPANQYVSLDPSGSTLSLSYMQSGYIIGYGMSAQLQIEVYK